MPSATAATLQAEAPRRHDSATILSAKAQIGDVEVETYALLRARFDSGYPRERVLASASLTEADWKRIDAAYVALLTEEARTGNPIQGRRYAVAYAEEWNKHAPRFASPKSESPRSPRTLQSEPRRTKSGTMLIERASITPPTPVIPAPIGGTVVMDLPPAPATAVTEEELRRYVAVCAALAGAPDRAKVLEAHKLTLGRWVEWSATMGRHLATDPALRARYAELLRDAIR